MVRQPLRRFITVKNARPPCVNVSDIAPIQTAPVIRPQPVLEQTRMVRIAARKPPPAVRTRWLQPTPFTAQTIGIVATGGTSISMIPANLGQIGAVNITEFVTVNLDAGTF